MHIWFRQTLGGLHKFYKINPDMAVLVKLLKWLWLSTNWKKEIMKEAQKTFISSTFWTERIGYVAGLATLSEMKKLSREVITKMAYI